MIIVSIGEDIRRKKVDNFREFPEREGVGGLVFHAQIFWPFFTSSTSDFFLWISPLNFICLLCKKKHNFERRKINTYKFFLGRYALKQKLKR